MNHLIISFLGQDRPGLVDSMAKIVSQHQGNWQVSSMHHLSGFFTGVIEVAVATNKSQALSDAIQNIEGLTSQVVIANKNKVHTSSNLLLELIANDREGIVQDISSVIHQQGGNLITLECHQTNAPHSGQIMFMAKAQISVNEDKVDGLIGALEDIEDDLMVDISR